MNKIIPPIGDGEQLAFMTQIRDLDLDINPRMSDDDVFTRDAQYLKDGKTILVSLMTIGGYGDVSLIERAYVGVHEPDDSGTDSVTKHHFNVEVAHMYPVVKGPITLVPKSATHGFQSGASEISSEAFTRERYDDIVRLLGSLTAINDKVPARGV